MTNRTEEDLPHAVWSGDIHGIKVHVLSNGQRIIDQDDCHRLFGLLDGIAGGAESKFDPDTFATDFADFMNGKLPLPPTGADSSSDAAKEGT